MLWRMKINRFCHHLEIAIFLSHVVDDRNDGCGVGDWKSSFLATARIFVQKAVEKVRNYHTQLQVDTSS